MGKANLDNNAGYEALAAAIVKLAVDDYIAAKHSKNSLQQSSLIKFFKSAMCYQYSGIEGDTLIRKVEDLVELQIKTQQEYIQRIKSGKVDVLKLSDKAITISFRKYAQKEGRAYHKALLADVHTAAAIEREKRKENHGKH